MLLAILLTAGLVLFQRAVVRRTGSVAIRADSLHYGSDLLVNLAVILALVLTESTGWPLIDPLFALGIVAVLLHAAMGLARQALDILMDRELPREQRAHIRELALAHPDARGVHDLRTRRAGTDVFIELHLELAGELSLDDAHAITDEVEGRIRAAFPDADILVHQEPAGLADERLDHRIAAVEPAAPARTAASRAGRCSRAIRAALTEGLSLACGSSSSGAEGAKPVAGPPRCKGSKRRLGR